MIGNIIMFGIFIAGLCYIFTIAAGFLDDSDDF